MQTNLFKSFTFCLAAFLSFGLTGCGSGNKPNVELAEKDKEAGISVADKDKEPSGISGTCHGSDEFDYPTPPPSDVWKRPVARAKIRVTDESGSTVANAKADDAGRFRITLKPGTYRVHASGEWIRLPVTTVRVEPGKFTALKIGWPDGD